MREGVSWNGNCIIETNMAKKKKKKQIEEEALEGVDVQPEEAVVVEAEAVIEAEVEVLEAEEASPDEASPKEEELTTINEIDQLKAELEETHILAEGNLDGWQRALAEFANYKKRIERERQQTQEDLAASLAKRYLAILDDLERALGNRPAEGEGATWAEGIELIYRKLNLILESEGIQPMEAEGQTFDPKFHEAILQEESAEHESGQIIEVIQTGYLIGERVLRPAQVRVAS